jgi:hypothetical protein
MERTANEIEPHGGVPLDFVTELVHQTVKPFDQWASLVWMHDKVEHHHYWHQDYKPVAHGDLP